MDWGAVSGCLNGNDNTVASLRCLPILFTNILNGLFMFAGIVAVFIIMISGFRFIASGGDAKQIEGARKTFFYAIAGLFLIFLSYLILNIIAFVTGVHCILFFGPFKDITPGTCAV